MVLESIIKPVKAEKSPAQMFYIGFFYSSIGLLLAGWVFGSYASFAAVFLTSMPLIVIMCKLMKLEEKKDLEIHGEAALLKEHEKALMLFIFLFIGMVFSYSFWFTILPQETGENLFNFQIEILEQLTGRSVGYAISQQQQFSELESILYNNFKVLAFCILFSFIYGAGAIFILTLNASVVGVAAGDILRGGIKSFAGFTNLQYLYEYFQSFPFPYCFLIHGIPEMAAYFLGALAGGIISFAVVNHDFQSKEFKFILIDTFDLILLALFLGLIAGVIEVFVTPLIC
jgi:uncharacterized membrane protein SpoIIM required for sporulation